MWCGADTCDDVFAWGWGGWSCTPVLEVHDYFSFIGSSEALSFSRGLGGQRLKAVLFFALKKETRERSVSAVCR